ncbi:MAG: succinate dehydrogenase, cytochrome b556 subunit [Rhodospirillales bacterium]|nr:succinate dehydrogenase, cytochrome b556 subunit [Rhodospirillales bacterium]
MAPGNRPLSPHLQIYRPQITSILSILHRLTGIILAGGAVLLTYWLAAGVYGPDAFARAQSFMASIPGRFLLLGWTFSLFFHLCNGIRHLLWDAGRGYELSTLRATGAIVLISSVVLTLLSWVAAYSAAGRF